MRLKRIAPKNLICLIEHFMNISRTKMPDENVGNSWIWGITQFSIPEASFSPTFLMHSTSWRTRALMKHTRKTTGCIPCSTTKVSNIPTRTSKQLVQGCCIVFVKNCLFQVDHFGIFHLKRYLFLHVFLLILFLGQNGLV